MEFRGVGMEPRLCYQPNLPENNQAPIEYGDEHSDSDQEVARVQIPLPGVEDEVAEFLNPLPVVNFVDPVPTIDPEDQRLQMEVINLSTTLLTNDQREVLQLGLRFRRMPRRIPLMQLVAGAELTARDLEKRNQIAANTFRISCSNTIQRAEIPRPNLIKRHRQALMQLRNNQAIVILTADKGGKIVILNAIAYTTLCIEHLSDQAYEQVSAFGVGTNKVELRDANGNKLVEFSDTDFETLDPSDKLLRLQCRRLTDLLTSLKNRDEISVEDRKRCLPGQPFSGSIPQFYVLPKVHKTGRLRIRPIVSNCDIYCDKLLIHLKTILNLVFRGDYTVKNSYEFVEKLDRIELDPDDRLVSYDVESLFTKVPVDDTLQIVERRLRTLITTEEGLAQYEETTTLTVDAFMALLRLVVKDFYFMWHGQLFRQKQGLPMGSRLSPVLANIFLEELEEVVLNSIPRPPKFYARFVDDLFIIYNRFLCPSDDLLRLFNEQHSQIRLTDEHEEQGHLNYLDLTINRGEQPAQPGPWKVSLDIFRKPTHCHIYLHYNSAVPLSMKRSTVRGHWLKGQRLLRNHPEGLGQELGYIKRTFQNQRNGYPRALLQSWIWRFASEPQRDPDLLLFRRDRLPRRPELQEQQEDAEVPGDLRTAKQTMLIPYVKGVSDRLRTIAARYGVKSWFSYLGRTGDGFSCTYKEQTHTSKSRNVVYRAVCACGREYVGECERNLKVRVAEHKKPNSGSSLSTHLRISRAHVLDSNRTEVLAKEKHGLRRKMLESMVIVHNPRALCNNGPSIDMSHMWFGCQAKLHTYIAENV